MAGTVKHARLESQNARERLKCGRQPHWQALIDGKVHLGYQRWKGEPAGRWVLRRYVGGEQRVSEKTKTKFWSAKYRTETLGTADDDAPADGKRVLSYDQAKAEALSKIGTANGDTAAADDLVPKDKITVRQAMDLYIKYLREQGKSEAGIKDVEQRCKVHILPPLGDLVVAKLSAEQLRSWFATMAASRAQMRPKRKGKIELRYRAAPTTDEQVRKRRSTANRVLTMLKAALNHAYDEGKVTTRDAWGRKLKPFRNVDAARVRYLTVAEAQRLLNASDPEFRPLVRAALETGARYSELARLQVEDFNPDAGTVHIRQSKSGKERHVVLTEDGTAFFRQHCAGRERNERMFRQDNGSEWGKSDQARPMQEASEHARIKPVISFHILRHTWASLSVMAGVPLLVVARNLGHSDTRMVEKHYGHLAPSYIAAAIRAGAPRFGVAADTKVRAV